MLSPVEQEYLAQARQMQALSSTVHIPLVCFGVAFPSTAELLRPLSAERSRS
jgi:cyanate permease